jgi:hypothetical protein
MRKPDLGSDLGLTPVCPLLLLVHRDDVYRLTLRVLTLGGGCTCFAVSGQDDSRSGCDLPILFRGDPNGLGVDSRQARGVPVRTVAGDGGVLPVVVGGERPVCRRSLASDKVDGPLQALARRLDDCGAALRALRFLGIDLPRTNQRIASLDWANAAPTMVPTRTAAMNTRFVVIQAPCSVRS